MAAAMSSTIAAHPQRTQIDAAIDSGVSFRTIARTFGVGRTALNGYAFHRSSGTPKAARKSQGRALARKLAEIVSNAPDIALSTARDHLAIHEQRAGQMDALKREARSVRNDRIFLAADRQLGEIIAATARLQGLESTGPLLSITNIDVRSMSDEQLRSVASGEIRASAADV